MYVWIWKCVPQRGHNNLKSDLNKLSCDLKISEFLTYVTISFFVLNCEVMFDMLWREYLEHNVNTFSSRDMLCGETYLQMFVSLEMSTSSNVEKSKLDEFVASAHLRPPGVKQVQGGRYRTPFLCKVGFCNWQWFLRKSLYLFVFIVMKWWSGDLSCNEQVIMKTAIDCWNKIYWMGHVDCLHRH